MCCLAFEQPLSMYLRESELLPIGKTQRDTRGSRIKHTGNASTLTLTLALARIDPANAENAMGIAVAAFQ